MREVARERFVKTSGTEWTAIGVLLLCLEPAAARAQADAEPVPVAFEGALECPTSGETLTALGAGYVEGAADVVVHVEAIDAGGVHVRVSRGAQEPIERDLPPGDCATRARLLAIVIAGYLREPAHAEADPRPTPTPMPIAPGPSWAARLGAWAGLGAEVDPTNAALALGLEGGATYDAFGLRLAAIGTTLTGIADGLEPVERAALATRIDVAFVQRTSIFAWGAGAGLGALLSLVRAPRLAAETMRAAPLIGAHVALDVRLFESAWLHTELGADVSLVQDHYWIPPDGSLDHDAAHAPWVTGRLVVGLRYWDVP